MSRRTILFVMTSQTPDADVSDVADMAARDGTHLLCLLVDAAPALPMYAYGVPPYGGMNVPENWQQTVSEAQKTQKTRADDVEKLLSKSGASGEVVVALTASVDAKHHVARCARVSDEAIFAANLRDSPEFFREAASGVLFHSPIGFQVNASTAGQPGCVFVAWDSSEAAAAAVHAALPYLTSARDVVIGCFDPVVTAERDGQDPGTDVATWLSHRGCNVTVSQFPSGGRPIAECIQDRAKEAGADLVVMGAYGHARMIQTVFGGTTRSMVEQTELPVLLAH
ncbi:universal stress protein [uncultured Tateyamaria sp.]|uniref:universal stress protein n=1 Tax=uncultured Tateyamaria sp. TaxID=455651 RepID=UPI0026199229|nr:universal stress protein [uncultured Tateyamaria sp.]